MFVFDGLGFKICVCGEFLVEFLFVLSNDFDWIVVFKIVSDVGNVCR